MTAFPLPMVFAAWGFRSGGGAYGNAGGLASLCNANGIKTVAVQLGAQEYKIHKRFHARSSGEPWTTLEDAETLRRAGLRVLVWGVSNGAGAVLELQRLGATEADWLPQVEGPGQRDLVLDAAAGGLRAPAIVTNYAGAGDSAGEAELLRGAGVKTVLVECYNDAGPVTPYTDLERMLWQGTAYGWTEAELEATMGTYHGEIPASYSGLEELGRSWGLYLAEPMSSSQWAAFGAVAPPPIPTPEPEEDMEPVTDTQGREAIGFAVQAAAQNWGTDEKPRARLTVCRRIAQAGNDDPKWNSVRDEIVGLLDSAGVPK